LKITTMYLCCEN